MRPLLLNISVFIVLFVLSSCIREERMENTPLGNFEELWRIIDERYCFFEYKEIDWDAIYTDYKSQITEDMSDTDLFMVLSQMLSELRDGHVNLYSDHHASAYTAWFDEYLHNFNGAILFSYLGSNYRTEGHIMYTILKDNIGYMYCENFSQTITREHMDNILHFFADCHGLIIDVRDNNGGSIGHSTLMASHFTRARTHTAYIQHKTGGGHNDFSTPQAVYIEPTKGIYWEKPVAVLTNRQVFSAGNYFINSMQCFPQVTIIGDVTGGGSGLPFTSELPNGWGVRFSTSPHFDKDMNQIEFGIEPHHRVDMKKTDEDKGIDTIIETARFFLNNRTLF